MEISHALLPCKTCPWRVDQTAAVIPGYQHKMACSLVNTVGEEDAFRPIMACHYSEPRDMLACKGYLAQNGSHNINVRILVAQDKVPDPYAVSDACKEAGIELHATYPEVLEKLAKTQPETHGRRGQNHMRARQRLDRSDHGRAVRHPDPLREYKKRAAGAGVRFPESSALGVPPTD